MSFEPVKDPAVTVALTKPIQFMGVTITEVAMREPNAGDIFHVGKPVISFDFETGAYVFDEKKALSMVWRLSGIPIEGSLQFMGADDTVACFEAIGPFFVAGLRPMLAAFRAAREAEVAARASSTKQDEQPSS